MAYGTGYLCGYTDTCDPICLFYVVTYGGVLMCIGDQFPSNETFIVIRSNVIDNLCIPEC